MLDWADPNTWDLEPPQFRMYAGVQAQTECLVDEEDYLFFTNWLWVTKPSLGKLYFRRAMSKYDLLGAREGSATIYLHIEILKRAQGLAPTKRRCIADHCNGDSLDNRRQNLRWTTKRENNQNRFGSYYQQWMLPCLI